MMCRRFDKISSDLLDFGRISLDVKKLRVRFVLFVDSAQ